MDPLTAGLNTLNTIVTFLEKVWDAMPADQKTTASSDVAKTLHNAAAFITLVQDKINAAVR